jgi:hypothetical protein
MEYSRLYLQWEYLPLNARSYGWIWEGTSPFVLISREDYWDSGFNNAPKERDVIQCGAYRLRFIEMDFMRGAALFVREDWLGLPRLYSRKLGYWADNIYRRIILTLLVWNLAERSDFIPSWRDIKLVKWLSKWGKR